MSHLTHSYTIRHNHRSYLVEGLPRLGKEWNAYVGKKGIGFVTAKRCDRDIVDLPHNEERKFRGKYVSIQACPFGLGARRQFPPNWKAKTQTIVTHATKAGAEERAKAFAHGKQMKQKEQKKKLGPLEAYCMSCKKPTEIANQEQGVNARGVPFVKGTCMNDRADGSACGGKVLKLGTRIVTCPGCSKQTVIPKGDYLCKDCRA